jgi:putative ATP-dependent endonuclease of OLD family
MGTGVQHMIMMGLILATTQQDTPIFFEEPEANLHLGSQRYLLDRLSRDGRQVFLTSHSPVFAAPAVDAAVYRIYNIENQTRVARVVDAADRSAALQSIGARNSDVLLSDAVIFVEGTSDRAILTRWAAVLGKGFNAHNVTVLLVGSTEAVRLVSRPRKEVLEGLSRGLPVAHRFLFDRDERTESELDELRALLGDALEVLSVREIENHLLLARPLVVHIRSRLKASGQPVPEALTEAAVTELISKFAKSLKPPL